LQHSWYFRIWILLWIVCAIVGFICFIILSVYSASETEHKELSFWTEKAITLNFPRFHFRTIGNEKILGVVCAHNNNYLNTSECAPWNGVVPPISNCVAANGESFFATNSPTSNPELDPRIICLLFTNGTNDNNTLLAWETEGANVINFGGNSAASMWIAPNNDAWIQLNKFLYHQKIICHNGMEKKPYVSIFHVTKELLHG